MCVLTVIVLIDDVVYSGPLFWGQEESYYSHSDRVALTVVALVYLTLHKISHCKAGPEMPDFTAGVYLVYVGLELATVVGPMMSD